MSMSILVTIFISLVIGMLLGVVLEGWWPQLQRRVDALNDYWIGAEICDGANLILGVMLITWEFPRLCRGGSRSLTYAAVVPR